MSVFQYALGIVGDKAATSVQSGAASLKRDLSSGKQDFDTDPKEWPIHEPIAKIEAKAQCSGDAFCFESAFNRQHSFDGLPGNNL